MPTVMLIFLGAGLGGVLRHGIGSAVHTWYGPTFPLGTLIVNVLGCLAMGVLTQMFSSTWPVREEVRLALLVGVLGGFTTFSSFGRETMALLERGESGKAGLYVLLSNVLGIGAVWAGALLAKRLTPEAAAAS